MSRPSLDEYYIGMLEHVAVRGTCPRRKVAAILVDAAGRLLSTGHNGNPSGMAHCEDSPCPGSPALDGRREDCEAVHAETNAVLFADPARRVGGTLYCSTSPCFDCAKLLITAGVRHVVCATVYKHDERGSELLGRGGISLWLFDKNRRTKWSEVKQ
jgi:dCMP deaminase